MCKVVFRRQLQKNFIIPHRRKQKCPLLPFLIHILTGVLNLKEKKKGQERQTECRGSGKQEIKLSLSEDRMFIYIKNPQKVKISFYN